MKRLFALLCAIAAGALVRPSATHARMPNEDPWSPHHITGLPPDKISRAGIARSYQITNILPNATTLENVRIAAQSRRHGWNMFRNYNEFGDIIEKAEAVSVPLLKELGLYVAR